jgi:hypothetical protein
MMKKLLAVAVFALGTSSLALAQSEIRSPSPTNDNVAMDFAQTSAASLGSATSVTPTPFFLAAAV